MADDGERPSIPLKANDIPTPKLNKAGRLGGGHNPFFSHDENGVCRKTGTKQTSSTGRGKLGNVDQTHWRERLQHSRIKFDDDQKLVYLRTLADDGLKGRAAAAAGVAMSTVQKHLDNDPEFAEMFLEALQVYNDMIKDAVRGRGVDGWLEPVYAQGIRSKEFVLDEHGVILLDEEGEPILVPASVRKFSDSLLALEAKRTDHSYRDSVVATVDMTIAGVLRVPTRKTEEEFAERAAKRNAEKISPSQRRNDAATGE